MNFPRAITAGLIGGITVDLFLFIVRAMPFPGAYAYIASTLIGPVAYTSSGYIALGLAMHFTISIIFALTYAFAASRFRALIAKPTLWGSIFGFAVMIVMQVILGIAHASQPPSVAGLIVGLIAHIVFFGLPVAWYIAVGDKSRALNSATVAAA